jgi:hypothetical protein
LTKLGLFSQDFLTNRPKSQSRFLDKPQVRSIVGCWLSFLPFRDVLCETKNALWNAILQENQKLPFIQTETEIAKINQQ